MRWFLELPPDLFSALLGSLPLIQEWVSLSAALHFAFCQGHLLWRGSCTAWLSQALTFLGQMQTICRTVVFPLFKRETPTSLQLLTKMLVVHVLPVFHSWQRWWWLPVERLLGWSLSSAQPQDRKGLYLPLTGWLPASEDGGDSILAGGLASRLHSLGKYEASWKSALCYRDCSWTPGFLLEGLF